MEEIIRNGAVFGGLLALPLLCWRTRWRHTTVFLGLVLGLVLGLWWEVLGTGWREGGPIRALALLLGWVAFTRLASQAGGPRLRGPSWIVAPLLGALVGDWGAALLLAPSGHDQFGRAPGHALRLQILPRARRIEYRIQPIENRTNHEPN